MTTTPPTHRRLRVGLLGTGGVASLHAEALAEIDGVDLVAVADTSLDRAVEFAAGHGVGRAVGSLDDLLRGDASGLPLDVVHLCTPPGGHAEQTAQVVAAGAHVVVEKPPALSLDQLDAMLAAARAADRELAIVFQQRTGTAAAHVKRLLDSGELGRVLLATCHTLWYRDADYYAVPWRGRWSTEGGGTTLSHGIHQIDLLAWLLGDWQSVDAHAWRLDRDVETEDVSMAVARFASGAVASIVTSVLSPRETSSLRIDTENATIELEHLYGHGHAHWRVTPARHVSAEVAARWAIPASSAEPAEVPSGHAALLTQVYTALAAGEPLPEVVAAPTRALELVTAVYASAATGTTVTKEALAGSPFRAGLSSTVAT